MFKLLNYILKVGTATVKNPCPPLEADARGYPALTQSPCAGSECGACEAVCPTQAITVRGGKGEALVALDLGACINCGLCVDVCPEGTIVANRDTKMAVRKRADLVLTNQKDSLAATQVDAQKVQPQRGEMFRNSVHARVVSTGCSATDMEIGASGNAVFDLERFGIHVVASPRYADALVVTGPVGKGMQTALRRVYEAMAEPRVVIALGTCAISGGVHKNGYAEANGVDNILPVDVYVPGCPPHPWTIVHGFRVAMGAMEPFHQELKPAPNKGEAGQSVTEKANPGAV